MKNLFVDSNMNPSIARTPLTEAEGPSDGKWSVRLWKLGERNLNGRTYTEEIAKQVIANNAVTLCNDGHERYACEYLEAVAVASEPYIEDGYLCCRFEFIDKAYEEKMKVCLEKNIPVGVSSVGFGACDEHGVVTEYELVRYFDFVNHPANEVYVNQKKEEASATDEPSGKSVSESTDKEREEILRKLYQSEIRRVSK